MHVVVPLDPGHSWDKHKDFSKRFAEALSLAEPERFIATMSKAKRKGKIFIDYLRNQRGSTADHALFGARAKMHRWRYRSRGMRSPMRRKPGNG